jgi:hypothetical protein
MKITKDQFKGIVREVMIDESEYQEFFKRALEKAGKSIPDMSDEEKKAFFNKIDAAWDAKGEKNEELTGNQHKLDVDGDGEIEASDLAALRAGKIDEAMASGAWVGLEKTPKGPKLVKTFKSGNEAKAWVMKSPGGHSIMTKKQWDVSEGKSKTNEAGDERFDWPPVLDKFKGKEIDKVEAEYKASLDKSSAILDKQRQLIRTTLGNKFEFPWENYDKWPAKLKAEVQKLNSQIDKEREKQPAMFKKLMQARGTWR